MIKVALIGAGKMGLSSLHFRGTPWCGGCWRLWYLQDGIGCNGQIHKIQGFTDYERWLKKKKPDAVLFLFYKISP